MPGAGEERRHSTLTEPALPPLRLRARTPRGRARPDLSQTPRRPPRPRPDGSPGGGDPQPPRCLPRRGGAAAGREAPLTSLRATAA